MAAKELSPMMQRFLQIKREHPDCLVLFQCGDFYETFFEDAQIAARDLDIVLTSRDKNSDNPIPMAGVPIHAAAQYTSRLLEKGHKVVVVDQMEDPKQTKKMVKRSVVRIVTPGTVYESDNLAEDTNNYLVALLPLADRFGIAVVDISTAEFRCTEVGSVAELTNELTKLAPREVLLPDAAREALPEDNWLPWGSDAMLDYLPDVEFDRQRAEKLLCEQFETDGLSGFGIEKMDLAIGAAGALLGYVGETQKRQAEHIRSIHPYSVHDFMVLDETTKTNLELERTLADGKKRGSLLGVLDQCRTPIGTRTLRRWINYPLMDLDRIRMRQAVVEDLFGQAIERDILRELLKKIGDLSRLTARITMDKANARHLSALGAALLSVAELNSRLSQYREDLYGRFIEGIDPLPELADELVSAIADDPPVTTGEGKMFRKGYHAELDELIELSEHGKDQILAMEAGERERRGFPLKIRYNRVFGYYIEVSRLHSEKVPETYIRKQTLTNAERYITPELKEFEEKVINAEHRRGELERRLFEQLRLKVAERSESLMKSAELIGILDTLASFAYVAEKLDYVCPAIGDGDTIDIIDGRHPVVETMQSESFIPNDTLLDRRENQLLFITGPNMAGKSTVMRQVALIVLMAQMGSFVPAKRAEIGRVDRIFTRVGAADNLVRGQSTFMVEMTETSNILHNASPRSLIVLDEIGRGTSTFDGLSIAWATAEYIHDKIGAKTLFATHYHELTELAGSKARIRNQSIAVKEWGEKIIFLRKLVNGPANRSYGIQVGRLAGLPGEVIARAKEVLHNLEHGDVDETGLPTLARMSKRRDGGDQLSLFGLKSTTVNSAVLDELDKLIPDALSPMEALNLLFEWKRLRDQERDPE